MDSASQGVSFTVYKGSPSRRIVKGTTHRDRLIGNQVFIRITHSSLCGTDEHYLGLTCVWAMRVQVLLRDLAQMSRV